MVLDEDLVDRRETDVVVELDHFLDAGRSAPSPLLSERATIAL